PTFIVTEPSEPIPIHESIWFGSIVAGPIGKSPLTAANAAFGFRSLGAPIATTSAPAPITKLRRLNVCSASVCSGGAVGTSLPASRRRRLGGLLDRLEDAEVRPAAAQVAVHQRPDLLRARRGLDPPEVHQRRGADDHGVRAVAALCSLRLDERRLQWVRLLRR